MSGAPNCNNPPWSDPVERDIVDEAWDVGEAVINHYKKFGNSRTYQAIKRRWYRVHTKKVQS